MGNKDALIKIVLHGLTGPIDGNEYDGLMMPMGSNSDDWIADVLSYIRNQNDASMVGGREVRAIRAKYPDKSTYWTIDEL